VSVSHEHVYPAAIAPGVSVGAGADEKKNETHCNTRLQHTATQKVSVRAAVCAYILLHITTHCNTRLQQTATHKMSGGAAARGHKTTTHCRHYSTKLQHTTTHIVSVRAAALNKILSYTQQNTAAHRVSEEWQQYEHTILQNTATLCSTSNITQSSSSRTQFNTLQRVKCHSEQQFARTFCKTPQHTKHRNTLQRIRCPSGQQFARTIPTACTWISGRDAQKKLSELKIRNFHIVHNH